MLPENKKAKRLKRNSIVFISRVNGQYLKKLNFHHSDLTDFVFQGHFVVVRDKFTWTWHSPTRPCKLWHRLQSNSTKTGWAVILLHEERFIMSSIAGMCHLPYITLTFSFGMVISALHYGEVIRVEVLVVVIPLCSRPSVIPRISLRPGTGQIEGCEDDFACLVWPSREEFYSQKSSAQKVLTVW